MKTFGTTISIALLLSIFCLVRSEEAVQSTGLSDASSEANVHLAKKRSAPVGNPDDGVSDALLLDSAGVGFVPDGDDDGALDKRSSLFRFGKRQFRYGKRQFRYGKRQFRYGKRQGSLFRFGKRGSLFRFGKRNTGTLFRFGRSGADAALPESDAASAQAYLGAEEAIAEAEKEEALKELLAAYLARQAELEASQAMDKRDMAGFHWGSDE